MVTRTGVIHIPRWAAKFVFGGRNLKNFNNLCMRNNNLITYVPAAEGRDWTTFRQPTGQIFAILTMIGYGEANHVDAAMHAVKSGLMATLRRAKQMKTDGTWRSDDNNKRMEHRKEQQRQHHGGQHHGGHRGRRVHRGHQQSNAQ
jgi:hypothetical protein